MRHKPPKHLSLQTRKWWTSVCDNFVLEDHHRRLLELACESWDRCQAARAVIDHQGMVYIDRFGAPRARPEVAIERDSKLSFVRIVRELDLDVEAPPESSRPPPLKSNRR